MKIDFLSPATAEFKDAIAHYNLQSEGLGFEFAAEVKRTLERIVQYPEAWSPLSKRTRRCRTNRFPYGVIYVRTYIESLVAESIEPDKRFVYYLLGATGICVIPLTSFFTDQPGFRMTLLERDEAKFEHVVRTLGEKIVQYVESTR